MTPQDLTGPVDRQRIHEEMERSREVFHALVTHAARDDLRRRSSGTRWSNQQLLFHMYFGYLVVRRLRPIVRVVGAMPPGSARSFARVLDAAHRPFHLINYLGSCGGGAVVRGARLTRWFDRTVEVLHRGLDAETEEALRRTMAFPTTWDPCFRRSMTLAEVYRYGTAHFEHHRHQLTLGTTSP